MYLQLYRFARRHPKGIIFQSLQKRSLNDLCTASTNDDYRKAILTLMSLPNTRVQGTQMVQHPPHKMSTMLTYLSKCGIDLQDLEEKLSIIHVSGTKGKGSTCAYCECILRQYGYKTGFFSSPHLCSVRERIRINGKPLSKGKFVKYFRSIYDKLLKENENKETDSDLPNFFMLLTIMAFEVFVKEHVDVCIIEVGIGGEYDCTNILKNTNVVGISSLGLDHVQILGQSIAEIAWQKAGIIKPSSVVVTAADQPRSAMEVLKSRAAEKGRTLYVAPDISQYESSEDIVIGVGGPVQKLNASLALQLTNAWMNSENYLQQNPGEVRAASAFALSREMKEGLQTCSWPGRMQIVKYSTRLSYYLDGAHTDESIRFCLQWYEQAISSTAKKVLVFNVTGNRDTKSLLKLFLPYAFDFVCFCTNRVENSFDEMNTSRDNCIEDEKRVEQNHNRWLELNSNTAEQHTMQFSSVDEVHELMQKLAEDKEVQVLVTGSLHLVGAFLTILGWNDKKIKF